MFVSAYQTDITARESRGIVLKRACTVKGGTAMLSLEQPMIPPEVWRASWGIFVPQTEDIYKRKRRIPLLRISTSINLLSNINLLYLSSSFILPTFLTLILCYPVLLHFGISSCLSCINLSDTFSPSAHMLCLSCAQSISPFIPFLAALSLSLMLTLGPSGFRGAVLTVCMKGHLLQLEAFYFCLSLFSRTIPTISLTLSRLYDSLWN